MREAACKSWLANTSQCLDRKPTQGPAAAVQVGQIMKWLPNMSKGYNAASAVPQQQRS